MNTILIAIAAAVGVMFLWGVVSPRSQWHILVGWTRRDARASEPGGAAYSVTRFISLIGVLSLLTISVSWAVGGISFDPDAPSRTPSVSERVWGQPRSYVVDRVFSPLGGPPESLVEQAVTGYQFVDGALKRPRYLFETGKIRQSGLATEPGFLGVQPLPDAVALDTADIVVHVRGDDRCIPQQVVVRDAEGAVQVGVFFGQPLPAEGEEPTDVANCDPSPPEGRTRGFLVPIDLAVELGNRTLQALDGTPIDLVPLPAG